MIVTDVSQAEVKMAISRIVVFREYSHDVQCALKRIPSNGVRSLTHAIAFGTFATHHIQTLQFVIVA